MFKYLAAAKVLKKHNAQVDNAVFHLHYRVTFVVFVISGALVTAKEFIGAPIQCISKSLPTNVLKPLLHYPLWLLAYKPWDVSGVDALVSGPDQASMVDHRMGMWFFVCEALCLVVAVGNIYFTDLFLGGTFMKYGTEVINFPDMDPENRVDPMTRIFPRVTKCTFR
nr:innexin inx2-like [Cherax quadricarinatus]